MADENLWLPPRPPEGAEAPRFERSPEVPEQPRWEPPQPAAGQQQPTQQPWQQPQPQFVQPHPATGNGMAVAALVLSIAGLALLVFTLGLGFFLSLVCSGLAWGLAVAARRRVAKGEALGGESQAKAGLIMAIIGVALGIIAMIVWIVLIASGFDLEAWQRELERELERQRDGGGREISTWLAALRALWP